MTPGRRWLTGAMVLVMGALTPMAAAEEPKKLDPVVVTATKIETPASQLGAAVTVITGEEIRYFDYTRLDDPLRAVPGVEVRRSGSLGKTTSISIRGANSNQVQVLMDGMRVSSPTTGQTELADISVDMIERIEVIRGPQSTLYGADAIGGVVNIITRKGTGPFSATVQTQAGNYDTLSARGTIGGTWKVFDYAVGYSHLESNGQFKNDNSNQDSAALRLGVTLPLDTKISFALRWNKTDSDLSVKFLSSPLPIVPVNDPNNEQTSETLTMSLAGHTRPLSWWGTDARVSQYSNRLNFVDRADPGYDCFFPPCEFPGRFHVRRREAELLNHFHVGPWSTSTVGLEYRDQLGDLQGSTPFHAEDHTKSVFFQQQFRFFDRLFMGAGFRTEDNSVFGTHTTERGSLAFLIKEWGTRIRGSAGSGFRAPTFNDLFFPGFSDQSLQPETSFSYDFGIDQRLWKDRIRLGLTYFSNSFKNLISFEFTTTAPFVKGVNIGKARAAGIEFTSEVDILDTLTASLNYTYTDSENLATDQLLPREARHRWNIGLTWQATPRLSLFTQVYITTEQFEPTGGGGGTYNSGWTRVDVGGAYRLVNKAGFLQALDITARIQNLLNEGYAEVRGFPALGINALAGLRASF